MSLLPAFSSTDRAPRAGNQALADLGFERWNDAIEHLEDGDLADWARRFAIEAPGHALLAAIFGNSPYLTRCLTLDIALLKAWVTQGPDRVWPSLLAEAERALSVDGSRDSLMALLRIGRRRASLIAALSDIAGLWPLEQVTARLTDYAEFALDQVCRHLLRGAATAGLISLSDTAQPLRSSGLIVLGMGKLGGHELNYSSDIDLIVLFDEERMRPSDPWRLQQGMVRLTRDLVQILEEPTSDGYVFRTDLRLRPDPGATPLAISVIAAETYYESMGQNWERAAMIKARPVAGDIDAGRNFLALLRPFVWRKHLDFAAIQDIHSIKRQINAHRGGGTIALAGHNVKLGRGGIREIEFFAQTQQLIWGGRIPSLRRAGTCDSLRDLAAAGRIEDRVADEMIESYRFLRSVEHRLQMIEDRQTHTLPADDAGLSAIAAFLGYPDSETFASQMEGHLRRVEHHYAELFEEAPSLGGSSGNLVFTGGEHDPDTLATLRKLGYRDVETVSSVVRSWHHGRYRAMRSQRARELLTEIMPALLKALAQTANPDSAFLKFDEFLSGLPAGVQLFSLLYQNPGLLDLLAEIMGSAPRLSQHLSRRPLLFDAVLTAGFFDPVPAPGQLAQELARLLHQARDYQDVLDLVRRWTADHKFQTGVQLLRGSVDVAAAARSLTNIADTAIAALQPAVETEFATQHGVIENAGMVVVGLGKLGSREMTTTSDLDLIFVYDGPPDTASDGPRSLTLGHYFTRLSQRLLNAITAQTGEGRLYEVDMRLRPSGSAGPIASSLESLDRYHVSAAWTWEHMALTRARTIAGPADLRRQVESAIQATLRRPRDPEQLLADVADMRARIAREHHTDSLWRTKHVRGGLIDIEFIAQYLQLRHASDRPDVLATGTAEALRNLRTTGILDEPTASILIDALSLWSSVQAILRLTSEAEFLPEHAGEGAKNLLARTAGATSFDVLERRLADTAAAVHGIFRTLIEEPASRLASSTERKHG